MKRHVAMGLPRASVQASCFMEATVLQLFSCITAPKLACRGHAGGRGGARSANLSSLPDYQYPLPKRGIAPDQESRRLTSGSLLPVS